MGSREICLPAPVNNGVNSFLWEDFDSGNEMGDCLEKAHKGAKEK